MPTVPAAAPASQPDTLRGPTLALVVLASVVLATGAICSCASEPAERPAQTENTEQRAAGGMGLTAANKPSLLSADRDALEDEAEVVLGDAHGRCRTLESEQKWFAAAKCLVENFEEDSPIADATLVKASANFERADDPAKAIQVRTFLLKAAPTSRFAAPMLVLVAEDYGKLGRDDMARKFYRAYLKNFPNGPDAVDIQARCESLGGCNR